MLINTLPHAFVKRLAQRRLDEHGERAVMSGSRRQVQSDENKNVNLNMNHNGNVYNQLFSLLTDTKRKNNGT